MNQAQSLVLGT